MGVFAPLLVLVGMIGFPVCFIVLVVKTIRKKDYKKTRTTLIICFLCFVIGCGMVAIEDGGNDTASPNNNEPVISADADKDTLVDDAPAIDYSEIYYAYEKNELVADDMYQYNRYTLTGKILGMENDGLLNLTGGATLTMEIMVGNTHVVFLASFESEQEEALKSVVVGQTITFEGTCLGRGSWSDCELKQPPKRDR